SMDKEQLKQPPQPWEFRSKPAWQRLIIMLAGIFVNFILAWLIYTVMLAVNGDNYISIDKMQENGLEFSEAMKHAGFQDGDKILTVDGKHQPRADWMVVDILLAEQIIVDRNGKEVPININDGGVKAILNGAKAQGLYFPSPKDIVIDSLVPNGNAIKAGLQKDDKIVGVNNSSLNNFSQLKQTLESHKNDSILVDIIRNGQRLSLPVKVTDSASLGFGRKGVDKAFLGSLEVTRKYGILEAIP